MDQRTAEQIIRGAIPAGTDQLEAAMEVTYKPSKHGYTEAEMQARADRLKSFIRCDRCRTGLVQVKSPVGLGAVASNESRLCPECLAKVRASN